MHRLLWVALGAGASYGSKWTAERSIAKATEDLEDRLPAGLTKVVHALPGDVMRVGGAAVVAGNLAVVTGRSARTAARTTTTAVSTLRSASSSAGEARSQAAAGVASVRRSARDGFDRLADQWRANVEQEERDLRSALARERDGEGAALEALLDLRPRVDLALPETPDPIPTGRRRARLDRPVPPVGRVQRTYRPKAKAWERPTRRR